MIGGTLARAAGQEKRIRARRLARAAAVEPLPAKPKLMARIRGLFKRAA